MGPDYGRDLAILRTRAGSRIGAVIVDVIDD
jgi:hypothetical protein